MGAFGADKLKIELVGAFGLAGLADDIAGGGGDDRSSSPLALVAMDEAVIGFSAELNSPKPSEALLTLRTERGGGAVVVFVTEGLGGGLGPLSKKFPPLSGGGFETSGAAAGALGGGID